MGVREPDTATRERTTAKRRVRGTGSVFYSESRGVWVGRVVVGRKPNGRALYAERSDPSQAELLRKLKSVKPAVSGDKLTVAGWLATWLDAVKVKPSTLYSYRQQVEIRLVPAFGHLRLSQLQPAHVENLRWECSTNTTALALAVMRNALNAAVRAGHLGANPIATAKRPRKTTTKLTPFTTAELSTIIAECVRVGGSARVLAVLAATGARIGEVLALTVGDYDPRANTISITKTVSPQHGVRSPKSPNSTRTIRVPAAAVPACEAAAKGRKPGDRLFPVATFSVWKKWRVIQKRLGLGPPWRKPHSLRHSVATALVSAGVPLGDVAKFLGDSVGVVVSTYLHPAGSDPAAALDVVLKSGRKSGAGKGERKSPGNPRRT